MSSLASDKSTVHKMCIILKDDFVHDYPPPHPQPSIKQNSFYINDMIIDLTKKLSVISINFWV